MRYIPTNQTWEILQPNGERLKLDTERLCRRFARKLSETRPGRWTAQHVSEHPVVSAGFQWRLVYEGGKIVDKGKVEKFLADMATRVNRLLAEKEDHQ